MNRKAGTSIAAVALCALAAAAPASAAPDRSTALGADKTTFEWTGDPVTSISNQGWFDSSDPAGRCGFFGAPAPLLDYCDGTLVTLGGPGSLDVRLPEAGDGDINDWDLFVYTADEEGTPGELLHEGEEIGGPEGVMLDEAEGNYLVLAVPYQAIESGYTGKVTFTPAPEAPAPG